MWASQLLTLYATNKAFINFDFSGTADYTGVNRVEVEIFNCPDMGIVVKDINLTNPSGLRNFNNVPISSSTVTPMNTSCESPVTVNIPCNNTMYCNKAILGMEIRTPSHSTNLTYIAEIRFCGANDCPSITANSTDDEDENHFTSMSVPPSESNTETSTTNSTTINESTSLPITLPAVFTSLLFIILVCVVGVVLLLWRCYCAKHHKHNTTALGEGTHASPHRHSHLPPITLCEETGQALYSEVQNKAGEDSRYSHLQHDTNRVKGGNQLHKVDTTIDQPYAQVHKKERKKKNAIATSLVSNTAVDQLYAQVGKKKSKVKDASATNLLPSETNTAVDQLYAQVDKKKNKKKSSSSLPPETHTEVDQLYAPVNKKHKKKRAEVIKDFVEESGAVYSVVNKPRAPQLPPKSDLLMEDENEPPPLPPQSDLLMEGEHKHPPLPSESDYTLENDI